MADCLNSSLVADLNQVGVTPSKQEEQLRLSIVYKIEHNHIDIPLDHCIKRNIRSICNNPGSAQ